MKSKQHICKTDLIHYMPLEPFANINETYLIISVRQITQGNLDCYIKAE